MTALPAHPILSCDEARALEARLFGGDEDREWPAMQRAGRAVGAAVLEDFREIGGFSATGRVLVLVGKGHNGGDALIAARAMKAGMGVYRIDGIYAYHLRERKDGDWITGVPVSSSIVRAWQATRPAVAGGK